MVKDSFKVVCYIGEKAFYEGLATQKVTTKTEIEKSMRYYIFPFITGRTYVGFNIQELD